MDALKLSFFSDSRRAPGWNVAEQRGQNPLHGAGNAAFPPTQWRQLLISPTARTARTARTAPQRGKCQDVSRRGRALIRGTFIWSCLMWKRLLGLNGKR
ncbi:uncharacterized protein V6R79_013248 [Siganus canaliculatus]